jgi:hypothetical protein
MKISVLLQIIKQRQAEQGLTYNLIPERRSKEIPMRSLMLKSLKIQLHNGNQ